MTEKINANFSRKCIVTNEILDISKLVRFDYDKKNQIISLDLKREKKGRGAYIHLTPENWEKAMRNKALNRTFRTNVSKEVYEEINKQIMEVLYEQKTK
ncbi:YlxR family protein [Mycoplasmopsis glycophila]|uniref:Transciprtional termination factor n=1 Tax=Mycoplasmopsis glycophila TaxID=171285 RepID=A0A449AVK2_9BACT|nr:YlxR family protein [Mycoplasmopsis glycophila]VEU70587.1 Putative transciprtional termination factor [Mycoplasmopsis glycophila]